MSSERPAKRIRQACESCRRKKTRCPGEKPMCSYCARLGQVCFYVNEAQNAPTPADGGILAPPDPGSQRWVCQKMTSLFEEDEC